MKAYTRRYIILEFVKKLFYRRCLLVDVNSHKTMSWIRLLTAGATPFEATLRYVPIEERSVEAMQNRP